MKMFSTCLAPERSDAVKLAAIDALVTIIVDVSLFAYSVPRVYADILKVEEIPLVPVYRRLIPVRSGRSPKLLRASISCRFLIYLTDG